MNNRLLIGVTALLLITVPSFAQESAKIDRELTIEKEYAPMIRDAAKINALPQMESPKIQKSVMHYADWTLQFLTTPLPQLHPIESVDMEQKISKKRGYASLGMGNYFNINGDLAYRFIDNKRHLLGAAIQHRSTNGKVAYLDSDVSTPLKQNYNMAHIDYKYSGSSFSLFANARYALDAFNYYGQSVSPNPNTIKRWGDIDANQKVDKLQSAVGFSSTIGEKFTYQASIDYKLYNSHLGYMIDNKGLTENHLTTTLALNYFRSKKASFGASIDMNNLFYNKPYLGKESTDKGYSLFSVKPYYRYVGKSVVAQLGVALDISTTKKLPLTIAPNVDFIWHASPLIDIYALVGGGKNIHSLYSLSQQVRYINPSQRSTDSYTPIDATIGLRTQRMAGIAFEIFGGYKYTYNDYLLRRIDRTETLDMSIVSRPLLSTHEANTSLLFVGGEVGYQYENTLSMKLRYRYNHWNKHNDEQLSYKPAHQLEAAVRYSISPKFNIDMQYQLFSKLYYTNVMQYMYYNTTSGETVFSDKLQSGSLPNIHLLNLSGSYRVNDTWSVRLNLNNLLFQRYELWYGMPAQGFNAMITIAAQF